ncbi:MAG: regulatory protein RecX [Dehalococcoidia bacterium]
MRSLATRPRSVSQVRERLARRFDASIVDEAVAGLQADGLLDDAQFAEAWRSSRERLRPRSASMVRRELLQRGVARDIAEEAVSEMDDEEAALRAAQGPARRLAALDRVTFTRRLGGYLARRGFGAGVVLRTVNRLAAGTGVASENPVR